jgi:hypothetical protein
LLLLLLLLLLLAWLLVHAHAPVVITRLASALARFKDVSEQQLRVRRIIDSALSRCCFLLCTACPHCCQYN